MQDEPDAVEVVPSPRPREENFRAYFRRRYGVPYPGGPEDDIRTSMKRVADTLADWADAVRDEALQAPKAPDFLKWGSTHG